MPCIEWLGLEGERGMGEDDVKDMVYGDLEIVANISSDPIPTISSASGS